ncbi:phage baseplate protein [Rhizobium sp. CECT 9324]|uniref:phage baseplate protein n=1 Tax=Rhizobium sp. CECT 9324 TaxID=2845820 RepID=UPI001E2B69D8|nr:phage baseplate protein [Rhizobium sp. CECT 9324]CAH0339574.1 hypothetical protein RHI9324_01225 [Rhizobium sp. CECT 9324]
MADPVSRELSRQAARIEAAERRLAMMVMSGKVGPVSADRRRLRLKLGTNSKGEDVLGPWIRWQEAGVGALSIHSEPEEGEQMIMVSMSGTIGAGSIAVPGSFDQDHAAPSTSSDTTFIARGNTRIEMKDGQLVLSSNGVSATLTGDGFDFQGGKLSHDGKNIGSGHTHGGIERGGEDTYGPNPA